MDAARWWRHQGGVRVETMERETQSWETSKTEHKQVRAHAKGAKMLQTRSGNELSKEELRDILFSFLSRVQNLQMAIRHLSLQSQGISKGSLPGSDQNF